MTGHTFTPWVEPIAAQLRETRAQVVAFARAMPVDAWDKPSPAEGWTYKDMLAHLAVGDWVCQTVLGAVVAKEALDTSLVADIAGGNERLRQERAGRSIEELIAEVEAEGEETQSLLARLTEDDERGTQEGTPMSLGEYLRGFPTHDERHLAELRTAVDSGS